MSSGHDVRCFPNVCPRILNSRDNLAQARFQLEILSAKPGVVETSLKIEPYNCGFVHSFEGDITEWTL